MAVTICVALFFVACEPLVNTPPPERATPTTIPPDATPADFWFAFQDHMPYPYLTPLPPPSASVIDGTYIKEEPVEPDIVHCRRCPDYVSYGGVWLLRFDRGIFRAYSPLIGWRSLGSYVVSGNRLTLFNDPTCTEDIGEFSWQVQGRKLILIEIKDVCAIHLRAKLLTKMPWASCQPPNIEAASTDHWNKPPGCP